MSKSELVSGYSRLTLTNEDHAPAAACAHVMQLAQRLGFSDSEQAQIELGIEEATANVVYHAFPRDELNTFDLLCLPTALGLEIRIRDKGLPFDPAQLPVFSADTDLDHLGTGGLGTLLMRRVFDEVIFRNLGRAGKETCLVKHRKHAPIGDYTATALQTAPAQDTELVTEVRRMHDHEAIEVARCVYEAYGYSYPYEHIYYPERVKALNASGEILSVVAVTPSGRIAGHTALVFDGKDAAELAIAVTRPEFRGQGVARRIGRVLLDAAREQGVHTVYTKAVTAHTFTQQFCHALGFRDCALLPGHAPASIQFRNIAEHLQQRESCVLALHALDGLGANSPTLYEPTKHKEVLRTLYRHLGITPRWLPVPEPLLPDSNIHRTVLSASVSSNLELAVITLEICGHDLSSALQQQLNQLRREHIAVVELLLPLQDPDSMSQLDTMEKLGFFFTGVFPSVHGKHQLVMHYLIDPAIEYDRIHAYTPVAQTLLAYARQQDPNLGLSAA